MLSPNINIVLAGMATAGAPIPKTISELQAAQTRVRAAAGEVGTSHTDVVRVWTDEVIAGRDPMASSDLLQAVILQSVNSSELRYEAGNMLEQRIADAITDHLPDILEPLKRTTATASTALVEAHKILGDHDLNEVEYFFHIGAHAVEAHQAATKAVNTIRLIDNAWYSLAELTHFASSGTEFLDRFTHADLDQFATLRPHRNDTWTVIRAGLTLDMATSQRQVNERQHARVQAASARAMAADNAFKDQFRSHH